MGVKHLGVTLFFVVLFPALAINAQHQNRIIRAKQTLNDTITHVDKKVSLKKGTILQSPMEVPDIILDEDMAEEYLKHIFSTPSIWKRQNEPLRDELGVLLYHYARAPFDSTAAFLTLLPYDSLRIPWKRFYIIDSVKITVPLVSADTLAVDSISLQVRPQEMYLTIGSDLRKISLSSDLQPVTRNDTLFVNDSVFVLLSDFIPASLPRSGGDTTILIISDTLPWATLPDKEFPFRRMRYPFMTDSIRAAVSTIIDALHGRDSTIIKFTGRGNSTTDVWLNSQSGNLRRYWLQDMNGDSVTVWIGSPSRNTISMETEDGVTFKRQVWRNDLVDKKINTVAVKDEEIRKVEMNKIDPNTWKYRGDVSYLFSQSKVSDYWVAGGNDNISSALDINGYLYYTNKEKKVSWTTTGRLAIGLLWTDGVGVRKNLDVIDIASKVNHKAFGKFDFSGQLQFKTQSFVGKKYTSDTSYVVSKFFNPATLILGYGLDYKPTKTFSVNVSPLSYKGIYVPAAGKIDETLYGVEEGKKSKNEMGMYVTLNSSDKIFKKITMTNKIQFFSNFLNKPQNVDIDWEMTMTTSLSWFADIKLNTFLIYDDETLFTVTDDEGNERKIPKLQFKELLGLTLSFRF